MRSPRNEIDEPNGVRWACAAPAEIAIVRDPTLCARAGRAYAQRDSVPPFLYHIALVRVGRRYVALNMNAMHRAGEFMLEAILDDQFRFLGWVGT